MDIYKVPTIQDSVNTKSFLRLVHLLVHSQMGRMVIRITKNRVSIRKLRIKFAIKCSLNMQNIAR